MTINSFERDNITVLSCDGCGRTVKLPTCDWQTVLEFLYADGWETVPYDYGWGEGFEHFCSDECLDPEEWNDDD